MVDPTRPRSPLAATPSSKPFQAARQQRESLLGYLHECLAAEINWSRTINVLTQRQVRLFPLTAGQQSSLGRTGTLQITGVHAGELANAHAAGGSAVRLVMGALFLVGRTLGGDGKPARVYCAPLLEVPLSLSSDLAAGSIRITADEERFTVNYSLVAELLATDDEDLERRLSDLAEMVPDFPVDSTELADFWSAFRLIASRLPIDDKPPKPRASQPRSQEQQTVDMPTGDRQPVHPEAGEPQPGLPGESLDPLLAPHLGSSAPVPLELVDFYMPAVASDGLFRLMPAASIILEQAGRQPLSVLAELQALAETPLDQTAFAHVFSTAIGHAPRSSSGLAAGSVPPPEGPPDAWPLPLSHAQRDVLLTARVAPLTVVTGPPGTGKSYTITAIVLDALMRGETVLVASQMDKAVQVVADQVERIAGPLSIARSGGRAAQRALASKISKLTGPSSRLPRPDVSRARELRRRSQEMAARMVQLTDRFRRVVALQQASSSSRAHYERMAGICPLPIHAVSRRSLDRAIAAVRRAEKALAGQAGWLRRWWGNWQRRRALRLLRIRGADDATLPHLQEAIAVHEQLQTIRQADRELRTPAIADLLWAEISQLARQRSQNALDRLSLARQSAMQQLIGAVATRQQLRSLASLLRRRDPKLKRSLKQRLRQQLVLSAFRAWASTNRTIGQVLPLSPGLFDLVVIDEASQCDLASAAVALARGRRALVVGDPMQLRHVCFLSQARELAAFERHAVDPAAREQFRYSRRSLFDVAADSVAQDAFFLLDEHFRSLPPIIDFSNRHFYDGRLRIMTARPGLPPALAPAPPCSARQDAIRVVRVPGRRMLPTSVNPIEVRAVMAELARLIEHAPADGAPFTIGVISPFRDQVDAILDEIIRTLGAQAIARHALVVGTAHSLQGDEKDVVIFSTSIDADFHSASLRFLENPNLFNVAITRARRELIVITSVSPDDLPDGLLRQYLAHAHSAALPLEPATLFGTSRLADRVGAALAARGWLIWPEYVAAGIRLDLAAFDGHRYVAIFCDEQPDAKGADPLQQHEILERAGWVVRRISDRDWQSDWVGETLRLASPIVLD